MATPIMAASVAERSQSDHLNAEVGMGGANRLERPTSDAQASARAARVAMSGTVTSGVAEAGGVAPKPRLAWRRFDPGRRQTESPGRDVVMEEAARCQALAHQGERETGDDGRASTKPAALKSPSNASASVIRRRRMTAKLVASTNE